ncbi:Uncharacterised BCR, YnfA/UPF0060 family [Sphingomonas guangdongensis]|uniref:Uncharacterized BCR, YnfA/UPF0060 family n=1 Tax=Sphingomonas guangdongensis TaxID=1141890 RepID=A0A285R220_9SPHN|nr:Uncharacterised BCR, YnfA/UPF0060 family [Sphingomonas guangdongensis]
MHLTYAAFPGLLAMQLAGLFATWTWSRCASGSRYLVTGSAVLLSMVGILCLLPGVEPRRYLIFAAGYLLAGLLWAWSIDDLPPTRWRSNEVTVAALSTSLFALAAM